MRCPDLTPERCLFLAAAALLGLALVFVGSVGVCFSLLAAPFAILLALGALEGERE